MYKKIICWLLLCLSLPALAVDGEAILKKVDRNLEPESYESIRKLINIEANGNKKEFVIYSAKKGRDKIISLFLAPESDKGRTTLRLEDNMWLYIPNVGKPVRITSLQSITGGIFNNADILRIDYTSEYNVVSVDESPDSYTLQLKAKTGTVAYDSLKMVVDKKLLLPTLIECYAVSGIMIKKLIFSDIKDFGGGIKRPAKISTESPMYKGYQSYMIYGELKKRELVDEIFTLNNLARVEELRK